MNSRTGNMWRMKIYLHVILRNNDMVYFIPSTGTQEVTPLLYFAGFSDLYISLLKLYLVVVNGGIV